MKPQILIGFSNDHSGSMDNLVKVAQRDYIANLTTLKQEGIRNDVETFVTVVQCGIKNEFGRTVVAKRIENISVQYFNPVEKYVATGHSTPLFDSVGELITSMKASPYASNPETSFLVFVTTDGGENSSQKWTGRTIAAEIAKLQSTDRWTFVFRVPRGQSRNLTQLGIPIDNIQEWDQTNAGLEESTAITGQALGSFYKGQAAGKKSTTTFYTNLCAVSVNEVKASLKDISGEVSVFHVDTHENECMIRPFIESHIKGLMLKGAAFYQLTKTESTVQDTKMIIIRDKKTGCFYYGPAARQLIGIPSTGNTRIVPGNHGDFEIFIQSTSVNRKLFTGNKVLYWPKVGIAFTEGPSYQPAAAAVIAKNVAPVAPVTPAKKTSYVAIVPVNKPSGPLRGPDGRFIKKSK